MTEFLATTLSFPTVIFTVLLAVCCAYWLMVIVGALGIDALDFDFDGFDGAADGAAEGVMEGVAEGAAEGAAEGVIEGAAEGVAEGASEGVVEGGVHGVNFLGSILLALKLRTVPITLVLSLWLLFSWTATNLMADSLLPRMTFMPGWLAATTISVVAVLVSLPLSSIFVRPLGRVLKVEKATHRKGLVGKVVRIDTSRVDAKFGSAQAADGGSGLILSVRCDAENNLTRGSKALVVSYDREREVYEVTPVDDMLPSEAARK